jgi:hypothetical protein
MKKLIAGLLGLGIVGLGVVGWGQLGRSQTSPEALNERYALIDKKDGDLYFLDRRSLRRQKAMATFNVAITAEQPKDRQTRGVTVIKISANCQQRTYQTLLTVVILNGQARQASGVKPVEKAEPGTTIERALTLACSKP